MSLDGSVYIVRLLEIDSKKVKLDSEKKIIWPRLAKDNSTPDIGGVLLLHDATQPNNLDSATDFLRTSDTACQKLLNIPLLPAMIMCGLGGVDFIGAFSIQFI